MGDRRIAVEAGVHLDHRVEVLAPGERCEADPVDADDLGCDPLADLGLVPRVVEDDEAAVAVQVDEARGDDPARGVDRAGGVRGFRAGRDEPEALPVDHDRPRAPGPPVPSTTVPPTMTMSAASAMRVGSCAQRVHGVTVTDNEARRGWLTHCVRWSFGACHARNGHRRAPLKATRGHAPVRSLTVTAVGCNKRR